IGQAFPPALIAADRCIKSMQHAVIGAHVYHGRARIGPALEETIASIILSKRWSVGPSSFRSPDKESTGVDNIPKQPAPSREQAALGQSIFLGTTTTQVGKARPAHLLVGSATHQ